MAAASVNVEEVKSALPTPELWGAFRVRDIEGDRLGLVGWVLGVDAEVTLVQVLFDGLVVASAAPRLERPDMAEQFPDRPAAASCGFVVSLEGRGSGESVLELRAILDDQREVHMGHIRAVASAAGEAASEPKQPVWAGNLNRSPELDRYGRGGFDALTDESGITLHGWAFGTERTVVAAEVLDEASRVLGRVPICLERPDVVHRIGDVPGALRSGFMIRLEPLRRGQEVLTVRVIFEDGESELLGTLSAAATAGSAADDGGGPLWRCTFDTPDRRRVVVGRDGWLFLQGDRNDALGQHTGRVKFTAEDREKLGTLLRERREVVRRFGPIWLTAVVPDKEAVYAEFLPPEVEPLDRRPVHDFLEIAQWAGAPAIYLLDQLRAARSQGDLYIKVDTHWNHRGALVAYEAICREISAQGLELDVLDSDSVEWVDQPLQGDLGSKLYPEVVEGVEERAWLERSRARLTYDNRVRNHGMVLIYEQEDRDHLPTCMVFGESFAPSLLVFLKESFRRLVFVHTSMLVPNLIDRERPDVVLNLPIERFLIQIPEDEEALRKLDETARKKGGELPWSFDA